MANVFLNIPVPAVTGSGAPVNVSALGYAKLFSLVGSFGSILSRGATVNIEASNDGVAWVAVATLTAENDIKRSFAAVFVRATVIGDATGATLSVGSDDPGTDMTALPTPVANGVGAPVNISAFGMAKTFIYNGGMQASIAIEISQDGVTFSEALSFTGKVPANVNLSASVEFARVRVSGYDGLGGVPTVSVCAVKDPAAAVATSGFVPMGGPFLNGVVPNTRSGRGVYVNPADPIAADDGSILTPKLTITGAIAAIVAAGQPVDVATNNQRWSVFVAPGCYDEDVTIPVTVPWVNFISMGGVTLGDGNADALGGSTTPRNVTWTISDDFKFGTDLFGAPIPASRLGFFTLTADNAATQPLTSRFEMSNTSNGWRVSGSFSVVGGGVLPYTNDYFLFAQSLFVERDFSNTAPGSPRVHMQNCKIGLLTTFPTGKLVRAENCQFGVNFFGTPANGLFTFGTVKYCSSVWWLGDVVFTPDMGTGAFGPESGLFNCVFGSGGTNSVLITGGGAAGLVCDQNTLAAIIFLGAVIFPPTNSVINVTSTPSAMTFGNTDIAAAAGTVFLSPGFESNVALATNIKQVPIADLNQGSVTQICVVGFTVRHNIAAGNGTLVTYEVLLDGAPLVPAMTLTLATGAVGEASSTTKPVIQTGNRTISVRAIKGAGIGSGVINATAAVRFFAINS